MKVVKDYITHKIKIASLRFIGLRFEIKYLFLFSLSSITLIELWFNKIAAYSQIQYDIGVIFLKLCYSFTSAFIVYFLTNYLPKERRRVKSFLYVSNKVTLIQRTLDNMITIATRGNIHASRTDIKISEHYIKSVLKKINPNKHLRLKYPNRHFDNYYLFIFQESKIIKSLITELLALYDVIDDSLLKRITEIEDKITFILRYEDMNIRSKDLEFLYSDFLDLINQYNKLNKAFRKYKRIYAYQFHSDHRKEVESSDN